jgi:subtilisin family serine protease
VQYACDAGVINVSITHNDNTGSIRYPGRYAETLAVGATNTVDSRAVPFCWGGGSNYGPEIDVVAPGDWIYGAAMGGGYNYWCGTSQAAPLVSGLVGLMRSIYPSLGREEARHLLRAAAEDGVGDVAEDKAGFDPYYGHGRVNMNRTLQATLSSISLRVEDAGSTRIYLESANPVATSYDFIRGDLGVFSESGTGVNVGSVVCLEDDSPDADTAGGNEDDGIPAPGTGYFYLGRFSVGPAPPFVGSGEYGGSSRNRDRAPSAGDCAGS